MEQRYNEYETYTIAASLYEGGWRAEDRDWIIEEYGFTEENADLICKKLRDFTTWEAAEWVQDIWETAERLQDMWEAEE